MKPLFFVYIWLAGLASLSIIYSFFCYILPDLELYGIYIEHFGFMSEEEWMDYYTLIILVMAIALNCVIIYRLAHRISSKK